MLTQNPLLVKKMPYEDGRISKEDFDAFEKYVTSDEYKAKSAKAKESKSHDEYPHYMGGTPYAEKEITWKDEGHYSSSFTLSSSSTISSLFPRTLNWILAQIKKDDKGNLIVPNEKTKKDSWEEKVKDGEFQPFRTDYVLNRTLNRKEHIGRALGYGGKSTIRDVYGSSHRSSSSCADKENDTKMKRMVRNEVALIFQHLVLMYQVSFQM